MKRKMFFENVTIAESEDFAECIFRNVVFESGDFAFGSCRFFDCRFESGTFSLELCRLENCKVPTYIFDSHVGSTLFTDTKYLVE